jgi:MFS family permease
MEEAVGLLIISIGNPIGTVLQSYSDTFGRKKFILIFMYVLLISDIASALVSTFTSFVIIRFFYTLGVGAFLALFSVYAVEVTPATQRRTVVTVLWIIFIAGYLTSCVLGYFMLQGKQWQLMTLLLCIPNILAIISFHTFQKESIHYLWAKRDVD